MSIPNSDIHPTSGEIDPGHGTWDEQKPGNQIGGLRLVLLGTGDAGGVPLYGCQCLACERARLDPRFKRRPSTALVETDGTRLLIDAGLNDLAERFPAGTLSSILLTHYHPDHVQGLFHLRWGMGEPIDVWSPSDPEGCADLYKNSGLLRFHRLQEFEPTLIGAATVTPVPMIHSKMTFGYCLESCGARIAYLCDTIGLPTGSIKFLQQWQPDCVVLDCCYPPKERSPRNHNDVKSALECADAIGARKVVFTHLSHELDLWLMGHNETLPRHIFIGYDELAIYFHEHSNST